MADLPKFLAVGIGSMPFDDVGHAVDVSLRTMPEAPMWPQMPKTDFREQMEIQYSEGIPRTRVDQAKGRLSFDTTGDYSEELAEFYEKYLLATNLDGGGDFSPMAISGEYSRGILELERRLTARTEKLPFVKVQTTGPCSFSLTVVDQNKRAMYYNEEFLDVIVKALAMKCRWQIRTFAPFCGQVICFVDEPILSAFGSSTYVSVKRDDVVGKLAEVIDAIHAEGALAGIHCCGNTEWSIPIDAGADIVNFDSVGYGETIAMYPDAVARLFDKGGYLAWGAVPTSEEIRRHTVESLVAHLESMIDSLAAAGVDRTRIVEHSIVTPSCGTGTMTPGDAERVFELLQGLSTAMRARHGH